MKKTRVQEEPEVLYFGLIERADRWVASPAAYAQGQLERLRRLMPMEHGNVAVFDSIIADRRMRVDRSIPMADRPPVMVVGIRGRRIVRMDGFQGHDFLRQVSTWSDGSDFDLPDLTDPPEAGKWLPVFGIVAWAGDFQTEIYKPGHLPKLPDDTPTSPMEMLLSALAPIEKGRTHDREE